MKKLLVFSLMLIICSYFSLMAQQQVKPADKKYPEPVHPEDARRIWNPPADVQPVAEIVGHVVAAKWQHGHGVAADLAELAELGRGPLRSHRGARFERGRLLCRQRLSGRKSRPLPRVNGDGLQCRPGAQQHPVQPGHLQHRSRGGLRAAAFAGHHCEAARQHVE